MGIVKRKLRDGARWGVRKHPVGKRAHDIYRRRKAQYQRARNKRPRRRIRSR